MSFLSLSSLFSLLLALAVPLGEGRGGRSTYHVISGIDAKTVSQEPEGVRRVVLELEGARLVWNRSCRPLP